MGTDKMFGVPHERVSSVHSLGRPPGGSSPLLRDRVTHSDAVWVTKGGGGVDVQTSLYSRLLISCDVFLLSFYINSLVFTNVVT
jgi:hypothetical protein